MAEQGLRPDRLDDLPQNRSAHDFGIVSSSGELQHHQATGLGQKVPSSQHLAGLNASYADGGNNLATSRMMRIGSHASLHEAELQGGFQQGTGNYDYSFGNSASLPGPQDSGDALAAALSNLDVNDCDDRYGVSGLKRNPKSYANLSHGTGLHIDDGPEVQARTLLIRGITPELSDEELKADLQSFGDVQSLYTGLKQQGQILVTFFDSTKAEQAYSLLNGRKLGDNQLYVELQKSQKDAAAGLVLLFSVGEHISDEDVAREMSIFGPVLFARHHNQTAGCRQVYFTDVRNAVKASTALYPQSAGPPTITEDSESAPDVPVGMQGGMFRPQQMPQPDQYSGRSWADQNIARDRARFANQNVNQGGRMNSNPDLAALLNNAPPDTLDQLMRKGYLSQQQQHGSSNSLTSSISGTQNYGSSNNLHSAHLNSVSQGYGSSANLKASAPTYGSSQNLNAGQTYGSSANLNAGQNYGSAANLNAGQNYGSAANLLSQASSGGQGYGAQGNMSSGVGNYSQTSLPAVVSSAAGMGDSDFGNLKGSTNNLAGLGGMTNSASHGNLGLLSGGGPSDNLAQQLTPQQLAAYQSGLLAGPGALNKAKRSMTTNDLYTLAQASNQLGGLGNQFGSGQYDPSELSGWGGSNAQTDLETANLLAQAQALDSLGGLGGLGGLQRSVSALQLHQLSQQAQQQQALMQLAAYNPQILSQLSNLRLQQNSVPAAFGRGKLPRAEDNLGGGRLSRRAADPAVEAERRAQQDRHYALDAGKVERGEDTRTTLMIKNIPNKYTQKMLLQTIDEQFGRQYDFFYLPIDFKNKCNVGYAFINMVQPKYILPFMNRFNQRKWERFNSEKVCHISYARIQGKQQLVTHFQNSSLLHEDKRCRPILFKTDGELAGEQEPFPSAMSGLRANRARLSNPENSQSSNSLSSAGGSREGVK